ncbi:MAG: TonB-dependent receptor [Niabella sp.]
MRRFLAIGWVLFLSLTGFAQVPGKGGQGQAPAGSLYGKVVDSATGKGIESATIQLLQNKMDSATQSMKAVTVDILVSQSDGEFRLENIPVTGSYTLQISAVGYKTYNKPFAFFSMKEVAAARAKNDMSTLLANLDKDLGNIKLSADAALLQGVTVTGSKPAVQLGIDRKIYNVENNLTAAGGTAVDVLKSVPSVNVDIDGNISVRNASPQLFIDGRPTTLTLDQIPADQISSVEVITNPSARYDASGGTAGILNIVLKKTKTVGYNGSVRAGIDERGRYNFGGNLNVRQGKFNVFANLGYNQRKSISDGSTDRSTYGTDDTVTNLHQADRAVGDGRFLFARAGFDYFLDNRNTITVSGMSVDGKFDNLTNSNITQDIIASGTDLRSLSQRIADAGFHFNMKGGALGFVHNFPKSGHQLTADGQYNKSHNENTNLITNYSVDPLTVTSQQLQNGDGNNERLNAQLDYTNPLSDKSKLEAGVRFSQTKTFSNNVYNNISGTDLVMDSLRSSSFNYKDRVYAAYATFSSKIGEKFGYQIGLRLESSDYDGTVHSYRNNGTGMIDSVSSFSISYPVSLFPSVFLSQDLGNDQQLQLNYSRRINRPGFFQLFPFIDYSDTLNLSKGNPELKPEFTNAVELSYSKNFDKNNNLIFSVYYKSTKDLITRYQTSQADPSTGATIYVNTYTNANSGFVGGFEAVAKNAPAKWWDVTSNLNIYTSKIDDPTIETAEQIYSWFGKINNTFKLPKNFSIQLSGDYNSKTVLSPGGSSSSSSGRGGFGGSVSGNAQGYNMPTYGVDIAVKYEFLKNKAASVTLSGNDIFKTRVSDVYTNATYFDQHQYRTRDQQFFSINFAWRFGKFDASLLKRKNLKAEQEGMQGMPQ